MGLPPFSLSLSWCLSCSFLSSFLPVSHFCILFLLFLFVVFAFFLSSCSSVFVFLLVVLCFLNHNISFLFALHLVFWLLLFFFVFVAFIFCYFLNFGNLSKNISEINGNWKNSKHEKCRKKKTDILTRTVSTGVFTNSVFFFLFCVSLIFAFFAENTKNIGVSAPAQKIKTTTF